MKVLLLHNSYQQPGGEDVVVHRERALLTANGNRVLTYFRQNAEFDQTKILARISAGSKAMWAQDSYRNVRMLLRSEKPDIAHFHNVFPLISPSAYYACRDAGVPVVQTIHNYRLFCPAGTFFRDGGLCEECLEESLWRSVKHGCYRGSRSTTAVMALTIAIHRGWKTWERMIDCYIIPTDFARRKLALAGLHSDKILVKPNFIEPDPGERTSAGSYAVFVGRLTVEKGVRTLIRAWASLEKPIPLVIVGDGPLRGELERVVLERRMPHVKFVGTLSQMKSIGVIKGARFLVFPSEWYETFGLTMVEAFACGVPVICSRLGTMQEIVADNNTGLHFTAARFEDLAAKVEWAWNHPMEVENLGRTARLEYEAKYTPKQNYRLLMKAYEFALGSLASQLKAPA